jgi:hypothetical protein
VRSPVRDRAWGRHLIRPTITRPRGEEESVFDGANYTAQLDREQVHVLT